MVNSAYQSHTALHCDDTSSSQVDRDVAIETAVAISINGTTHAVMMCSPTDLRDFAIGFALTEGIITALDQIESLEFIEHATGIEAQFWLAEDSARPFLARRRAMAGPVGCGLCGIDSLEQAVRPLPVVPTTQVDFDPVHIGMATDRLRDLQPLHDKTHAVHAAGFMDETGQIIVAREDVGRHNALDKVIGALACAANPAASGAIVLTSRVSVEMVQKTAMIGAPMIVAVSAPTSHALELAHTANITLCARAHGGEFDCYTHPFRLKGHR
jgi:FdhD protein